MVARADHEGEANLPAEQPCDEEDDKGQVAERCEGEISQHLGELRVRTAPWLRSAHTYRQEDVTQVHQEMKDRADSREMSDVAPGDQHDGQDVVSEHLPVVVPSLLRVDHVQLVEPPAELGEVVEFGEGREVGVGVSRPYRFGRERGRYPGEDVTPEQPIRRAVQEAPPLLCKASDGMLHLPLLQLCHGSPARLIFRRLLPASRSQQPSPCKRRQDVSQADFPEEGERQCAKNDKVHVLGTLAVELLRRRISFASGVQAQLGEGCLDRRDGVGERDEGVESFGEEGVDVGGGGRHVSRHHRG